MKAQDPNSQQACNDGPEKPGGQAILRRAAGNQPTRNDRYDEHLKYAPEHLGYRPRHTGRWVWGNFCPRAIDFSVSERPQCKLGHANDRDLRNDLDRVRRNR
jgi:hypothetical protein